MVWKYKINESKGYYSLRTAPFYWMLRFIDL